MSALAFDPWATLECKVGDGPLPKAPNPPNREPFELSTSLGLGELGGLGGVASPECKTAISPAAIADADIRTEGEVWAEAWERDVRRLGPEWLLKAFREGITEHPPAAIGDGVTEPDDDAPPMLIMRLPEIPLDDHVEMLAEAIYANRDTAMRYLRPIARSRLSATDNPYVRGLLIGWERYRKA